MSHLANLKCPVPIHKENPVKFFHVSFTGPRTRITHQSSICTPGLTRHVNFCVLKINFDYWLLHSFLVSSIFYPTWRTPTCYHQERWGGVRVGATNSAAAPTSPATHWLCRARYLPIDNPSAGSLAKSHFPTCCSSSLSPLLSSRKMLAV